MWPTQPNEPSAREKELQAEIDALRAQREHDDAPAAPGTTTPGAGMPPADASTDVSPAAPEEDASPERPPFYCPGCGRAMHVRIECVGRPEAPHQPIEVVPSDELDGDSAEHTPAPATGE